MRGALSCGVAGDRAARSRWSVAHGVGCGGGIAEGMRDLPFEHAQYEQLVDLIGELRAAFPIEAVVGHSQISPVRKTDPGPCFDWHRLEIFDSLLV